MRVQRLDPTNWVSAQPDATEALDFPPPDPRTIDMYEGVVSHAIQRQEQLNTCAKQALMALGLAGVDRQTQAGMLRELGAFVHARAAKMQAADVARAVFGQAPDALARLVTAHATGKGLSLDRVQGIGAHFINDVAAQPNLQLGRNTMAYLGAQTIPGFDQGSLNNVPRGILAGFGRELSGQVAAMSPGWAGSELMGAVTNQTRALAGHKALAALPVGVLNHAGEAIKAATRADPIGAGTSFLSSLGLPALADIGQKFATPLKGAAAIGGGALAAKLLGAITKGGNVGGNIAGALGNFGVGTLLNKAKGALTGFGKSLFNNIARPLLGKVTGAFTSLVGVGKALGDKLLGGVGSKILGKLGGVGQAIGDLVSGKLDLASLAKAGISMIPGVGQIFAAVSAIPGVGGLLNKAIGGAVNLLKKIPGVGHLLKGAEKVVGFIGKAGKAIWKGIKKIPVVGHLAKGVEWVGKKIWGGIKTVGKKIWGGVKKVGKKIWGGIKKVGKAIGKGLKKIFSGW